MEIVFKVVRGNLEDAWKMLIDSIKELEVLNLRRKFEDAGNNIMAYFLSGLADKYKADNLKKLRDEWWTDPYYQIILRRVIRDYGDEFKELSDYVIQYNLGNKIEFLKGILHFKDLYDKIAEEFALRCLLESRYPVFPYSSAKLAAVSLRRTIVDLYRGGIDFESINNFLPYLDYISYSDLEKCLVRDEDGILNKNESLNRLKLLTKIARLRSQITESRQKLYDEYDMRIFLGSRLFEDVKKEDEYKTVNDYLNEKIEEAKRMGKVESFVEYKMFFSLLPHAEKIKKIGKWLKGFLRISKVDFFKEELVKIKELQSELEALSYSNLARNAKFDIELSRGDLFNKKYGLGKTIVDEVFSRIKKDNEVRDLLKEKKLSFRRLEKNIVGSWLK